MTARRALVVISGQVQELPVGDSLTSVAPVSAVAEPVVVAGGNTDVVYQAGDSLVPDFVVLGDGDLVVST